MGKEQRIYGVTASYPRMLAKDSLKRVTYFSLLAGISGLGSLILLVRGDRFDRPLAVMGFMAGFAAVTQILEAKIKISRAMSGIKAEQVVSYKLEKFTKSYIINGAILKIKTGDADHVVIGPVCAVVETKNGYGEVKGIGNGKITMNGNLVPRTPLVQARKQAQYLSKLVGVHATPILCLTNITTPPTKIEGVIVTSVKDLPSVINKLPHLIEEDKALEIVSLINRFNIE